MFMWLTFIIWFRVVKMPNKITGKLLTVLSSGFTDSAMKLTWLQTDSILAQQEQGAMLLNCEGQDHAPCRLWFNMLLCKNTLKPVE